jgi:hypothetical protein
MDSPKDLHAPSQRIRPRLPIEWVSNQGWSLIWIDAILLVPVIFGVMFLPPVARLLAYIGMGGLTAAGLIFYFRMRHLRSR